MATKRLSRQLKGKNNSDSGAEPIAECDPFEEAAADGLDTSLAASNASQNTDNSQPEDVDEHEIKAEEGVALDVEGGQTARDVSDSYNINEQSGAESGTSTVRNIEEVVPVANQITARIHVFVHDNSSSALIVPEDAVHAPGDEQVDLISQPQHRSSGESETDDAAGPGAGTDTGSEIEFVDVSNDDLLREFNIDITVPDPPEIISHLQKTFQSRRLIIDRMIAENFKSFGGTHHLGHFHPRFGIVNGPNGCGKSNVIDGLLFVFGYRSKRLRVERVSELIYNHPDPHQQPAECRVEVIMKVIRQIGPDEFEDVPGEIIRVARVGRRNGSSDYYLDGSKTPQKNVVQKLKTYGIDMDHHRFLILQGEVEQIALMPPKGKNEHEEGLLEYLEDIIGTSRLHEPMERVQQCLDDLTKDYEIKAKDQQQKRKEVASLEHNRREAEQILLEHNAINAKRYLIKRVERRQVTRDIDAAKQRIDAKQLELDVVNAELAQSDEIKHQLQSNYKDAQRKFAVHVKQREELVTQHAATENEISKFQVDSEHAKTAKTRLEKDSVNLQKEADNIDTLPERLQAEIAILEAEYPNIEQQVANNKRQYDDIVANANTAADKFRHELQEHVRKQQPIKTQRDAKKHALDLKKQENENTNRAYNEAKAALDALLNEQADLRNELDSLTEEASTIDDRIATKAQLLQDRSLARTRCREEIVRLEQEVAAKRIEVDQARQMHQQPSHRANDSKEIRALMQAKQDGTLPGIIGRLGDLAGIEQTYDVAICSLLQNTLNSVVVKTSADARACIVFLRERIGGSPVTFIDLERKWDQNGQQMEQRYDASADDGAHRLFDLIQFDEEQPKIKAVYYSFVRDTLVVDNTPRAMQLGFQNGRRRRVVTLQGNVIEPSGSMVGGGKPLSGLIGREARVRVSRASGLVVTPADLANLEAQLEGCVQLAHTEEDKLRTIEEHGRSIAEELKQLKGKQGSIPQARAEKELRIGEQLPALITNAKEIARQHEPNAVAAEQYRLEVDLLDKEIAEFNRQISIIEKEKKRIERCIQDESVGAVQEARAAWEESCRALKENRDKLQKKQNELRNSGQQLVKLQAQLAKKQQQIETRDAEISSLLEKQQQAQQLLERLAADVEALNVEEAKLSEAEVSARDALANHTKTREKHIALEEALRIEIDTMRESHTAAGKKVRSFDRELQQILTQIVELGPALATRNARYLKHNYTDEQLDAVDAEDLRRKLNKMERRLAEAGHGKAVDAQRILNQYRTLHDIWMGSAALAKAVETKRKKCEQFYRRLQNQRFEEFFAAYNKINHELKWIFRKLTTGGSAALSVADDLVFYENGIDFKVQPLMKPWREISHLSGGEKTLSSLALIFALHKFRPTPFYIMDEIDAALDHRNVTLVGLFVKLQAAAGQFIVVSHRPEMIVKADRIIGITKPGGQTCSLSITCDLDQSKPIQSLLCEQKSKAREKRRQKRETQLEQRKRRNTNKQASQHGTVENGVDALNDDELNLIDIDDDDEMEAEDAPNVSLSTSVLDTSSSSIPCGLLQSTMNLQTRFEGIRRQQQAMTQAAEAAAAIRSNAASPVPRVVSDRPATRNSSNAQHPEQFHDHVAEPPSPSVISTASTVTTAKLGGRRKRVLSEVVSNAPKATLHSEAQKQPVPPVVNTNAAQRMPDELACTTRSSRNSSAVSSSASVSSRRRDKRPRITVQTSPMPPPTQLASQRFLQQLSARQARSGNARSMIVNNAVGAGAGSRNDDTMSCAGSKARGKLPPRASLVKPQPTMKNVPRSSRRQHSDERSKFEDLMQNLSDASGS